MKKTAYLAPVTKVVTAAPQQMIAYSGGDKNNSVWIDPTKDTDTGDNRSRYLNVWDNDDDCDY